MLTVRLFGEFDLRYGGAPLPPLGSGRAESLFAYLLLHRDAPQPRQRLAFVLWPDSTEGQARTNLRHVLHILRGTLPEPDRLIHATDRTLQWRADAPFWLDVAAFASSMAQAARPAVDGGLAALRHAAELYTADLLEGYYDDWALTERERLRRCYVEVLERLIALLEAGGKRGEAIGYAERLLQLDPLQEHAYRILMRLHDRRGDRARALHVYHACAATLERELGVEPSSPTRSEYAALLSAETGDRDDRSAVEAAALQEVGAPLVGRVSEWERLTTAWHEAKHGRAHLVLLSGEPGIGKTRLVEELRSWCAHRGVVCAGARSYQAEGGLAYGPLVSWLRYPDIRRRIDRLEPGRRRELGRLLPELVEEDRDPPPDQSATAERDRRQRLLDAAATALVAPGRRLLLVADDIHWCDPETLQFVHYLLRTEPEAPLLVAATARSGETGADHPLGELLAGLYALGRVTEIEVGRLTFEETAALAARVAEVTAPVEGWAARRLFDETAGNPLFVVEAVRAGWRPEGDEAWVSPKVQAVIESHLGRLSPPARALTSVAATVGREFSPRMLTLAAGLDEEAVVQALDELWRHRVIREHDADAYDFSHDKVREVAYRSFGPAGRRLGHLRVAQALEEVGGDDLDGVSGQLAVHYEQAGAADVAASWYRRAAGAAQRVYASSEAVRLLERALGLLRGLAPSPPRLREELAVLTALPASLAAVEGYGAGRVSEVHERALEVARLLGVEPQPPLLRSMAIAGLTRGDFAAARQLGARLEARGDREGDDILVVEGQYVLGVAAFWLGEFQAARRHLQASVDRYRPEHRAAHLSSYGQDPKVVCLARLGNTLWFLGEPEASRRASDEAVALGADIGHPYSRAVAVVFHALLALDAGDSERVRRCPAQLGAGADGGWPPQIALFVDALEGYLDVLEGTTSALERIRRAVEQAEGQAHAPGFDATLTRVLAAACDAAGDANVGLAAADRLITMGRGAAVWEAEARRLRARFLADLGAPRGDVGEELRRALEVARRQPAVPFEHRVIADLGRRRPAG